MEMRRQKRGGGGGKTWCPRNTVNVTTTNNIHTTTTHAPSTYKIPGSRDVPEIFEVRLLANAPARADTIFRSKAVGEPPLMLPTAVWNALIDAAGVESLDIPVTPERLLLGLTK